MKKLQSMAADEQASLHTTVTGDQVSVTYSVKPNGEKGSPRYNLTNVFDFTGVSQSELYVLATRSLRIDVQAIWRKASDKMNSDVWQDRKFSVRSMLDQTRQKADPVAQVLKKADSMSKNEIMALVKQLEEMV